MFYEALDAYLGSLDAYSGFLDPREYREWNEVHAGRYAGIGVRVDPVAVAEGVLVLGVFRGGPADAAGIRVGDLLVAADGRSLAAAADATSLLKGAQGTEVAVRVRTPSAGGEPPREREVRVVRDHIQQPTVHARRVGPGGRHLHLSVAPNFFDTTADELDRLLDAALADGVRGVALDLRGNGGGVLPATVRIADRFLRAGDIVRTVGRTVGGSEAHVAAGPGTIPDDVRLVVLVDGGSASASELLAGAIQDHRRGVLVGTRTHGKFLVQSVVGIPGKEAGVRLTTARYTTPLGRWFRRERAAEGPPQGLLPDVVVPLEADAKARLERQLENRNATAVWGQEPPHPEVGDDWVDPQLEAALRVLDGEVVLAALRPRRAPASRG
jgi:carboxyl-terminal processing protease